MKTRGFLLVLLLVTAGGMAMEWPASAHDELAKQHALQMKMTLPAEQMGAHILYMEFDAEVPAEEAYAALGKRADMIKFYTQTFLKSACDDASDCAQAIEDACAASGSGGVTAVEFNKLTNKCAGKCANGTNVEVVCSKG